MAPISLLLLNPLGFLCMEVGERLRESRRLSQKTAPIQQVDASDNQLSRKVSTGSTGSLSNFSHRRGQANGCKVPFFLNYCCQTLTNDNLVSNQCIDIFDCLEKYVVYSNCCNDCYGNHSQLSLRPSNTSHSQKPVWGNLQSNITFIHVLT